MLYTNFTVVVRTCILRVLVYVCVRELIYGWVVWEEGQEQVLKGTAVECCA